jgi:hypothetical protein
MVNVDFSPALLLGMGLIAGGLSLYQLRRIQPDISRDFDVIVTAVATFSGGILIFQVLHAWKPLHHHPCPSAAMLLLGHAASAASMQHVLLLCLLMYQFNKRRKGRFSSQPIPCRAGAWTHCCCSASC